MALVTVFVLDVGASMADDNKLERTAYLASSMMTQSAMLSNKEQTGLVLIGTDNTENALMVDGYPNITTAIDPQHLTTQILSSILLIPQHIKSLSQQQPSHSSGDLVDGLVVAMDLVAKFKASQKKCTCRIVMLTDAITKIDNPEDLDVLARTAAEIELRINIVGIGFDEDITIDDDPQLLAKRTQYHLDQGRSQDSIENEMLLRKFSQDINGTVMTLDQSVAAMSYYNSHSIRPTSNMRGILNIAGQGIRIWSYVKTKRRALRDVVKMENVSVPALQDCGKVTHLLAALDNDEEIDFMTGNLTTDRKYCPIKDPNVTLEKDDMVKAFKYGTAFVPATKADMEQTRLKHEKAITIRNFQPLSMINPRHIMDETDVIVPEPDDPIAAQAFAALVVAMRNDQVVAIARVVKRNNASPKICMLKASNTDEDLCLYSIGLAYYEDEREFPNQRLVASVDKEPTPQQRQAMGNLIDHMNLSAVSHTRDTEAEFLAPEETPNPYLHRAYESISNRAMEDASVIPELNPLFHKFVFPDAQIVKSAGDALNEVASRFPLTKKVPKNAADETRKQYFQPAASSDPALLPPAAKRPRTTALGAVQTVTRVGTTSPVADLKAIIKASEDGEGDFLQAGLASALVTIREMVDRALAGDMFPAAFETLKLARDTFVAMGECKDFNDFLYDLREAFDGCPRRGGFWDMVKQGNVSVITVSEVASSEYPDEKAAKFLDGEVDPVVAAPASDSDDEDEDDID